MKILVLNSGSSSQKSALYEISSALPADTPVPVWQGQIEWDGNQAEVHVQHSTGANQKRHPLNEESRRQAIEQMASRLCTGDGSGISATSEIDRVGHRILHR